MKLIINDRVHTRTVEYFSEFKLNLKYDSIASTFSFKFYFDHTSQTHAETACVSHFHEAIIEHNGEKLITGYILSNAFNTGPKEELVEVAGYSKPGVLEDCDIPPESVTPGCYPLETTGLTLKEITQKLIKPFSIGLVIDAGASAGAELAFDEAGTATVVDGQIEGESFSQSVTQVTSLSDAVDRKITKANAKQDQNIRSFLMELAVQRNIILSHDVNGNLLFTEAQTNKPPIMDFNVPESGLIGTSMNLSFNGQGMHSHITVVSQPDATGDNAGEFTIRNPYCPILFRPKVVPQTMGTNISLPEFARQQLAAELKNIILTITIDRWDMNGALIKPNNTITVYNPKCFIYKKTTFFIESVAYTGDAKKTTAVLTCVPPEAYNKQSVKNMFVDPHKNFPRL